MMTTRARSGSSRALAIVPPAASGRERERALEARVRDRARQPLEVLARVAREVEVELGDRSLHDAPGGLAGVGEHAHQLQLRTAPVVGSLAVVGREQALVRGLVEAVVDRQVA